MQDGLSQVAVPVFENFDALEHDVVLEVQFGLELMRVLDVFDEAVLVVDFGLVVELEFGNEDGDGGVGLGGVGEEGQEQEGVVVELVLLEVVAQRVPSH